MNSLEVELAKSELQYLSSIKCPETWLQATIKDRILRIENALKESSDNNLLMFGPLHTKISMAIWPASIAQL